MTCGGTTLRPPEPLRRRGDAEGAAFARVKLDRAGRGVRQGVEADEVHAMSAPAQAHRPRRLRPFRSELLQEAAYANAPRSPRIRRGASSTDAVP